MAAAAAVCVIGGPALVYYVQPDPEELFKKYNPELQKKVLAERDQRRKDQEEYLKLLKEQAHSDKPFWVVAAEQEKRRKDSAIKATEGIQKEAELRRQQMIAEQTRTT